MTNSNDDLVKEWYKFAMRDLTAAGHLYETMHPKPLEIICYLSQQAAEKMLKAFLVSNEISPPRTHDLRQLCEMCIEISDSFDNLKDVCTALNPYGVQPRYPNEMEILETDAEMALQSVKAMRDFFEAQDTVFEETFR